MGIKDKPSGTQPPPKLTGYSQSVPEAVCKDQLKRSALGKIKYGQALHTFNGRDPLQDAYEETLDLAVYLKQHLMEKAELNQRPEIRYMDCKLVENNLTKCAYDSLSCLEAAIRNGTREATVTGRLMHDIRYHARYGAVTSFGGLPE